MPVREEVVDPADRVRKAAEGLEPAIALAFFQALNRIQNAMTLTQLADLLERGEIEQALRSISLGADRIAQEFTDSALGVALGTVTWANRNALVLPHTFNPVDVPFVSVLNRSRLQIIEDFTSRQRESILLALQQGASEGLNSIATARKFRSVIGLTPSQVNAVENYRRLLEEGNRESLRRELRDRRSDQKIDRLIRQGEDLDSSDVNRLVEHYRQRQLRFRAERIARSESLAAANQGSFEAYEQMLREGALEQDEVLRTWNTNIDGRERPSHNRLNGTTVKGDEKFQGDFSQLKHPHDPEAAAEERVNCRCALQVTLRPIQ